MVFCFGYEARKCFSLLVMRQELSDFLLLVAKQDGDFIFWS